MSASIIEFESFLEPISEDNPCGEDIRENPSPTSDYQTIKAARNSARTAERNNMFDSGSSEADDHWRKVLDLAPRILKEQGKDLEIASWYTEAMVRKHGLIGLKDCLQIINGLINNFWDGLYPLPDEYGIETRVSPIAGLNGEGSEGVLIAPIRNCKITEGGQQGPYTYWQYQQALETQRIADPDKRRENEEKHGFNLEDVESAVNDSSSAYFVDLRDALEDALAAFQEASNKLDELCGAHDAPPTRNILNIIKECLGAINHLAKNKFPIEVAAEEEGEVQEGEASGEQTAAQPVQVATGAIQNRDQAFKRLLDIADYFRENEPHSPVSYVLEKAVKWGNMPLNELMQELIPDSNSREHYSELTGVKTED